MQKQDDSPPILLLCEDEKSAQLDRRAIRDAGYSRIAIMNSGIDAARLLAGFDKSEQETPKIVICSQKLADMDGEQFCAIIRQHPLLMALPILLLMPNDSEAEQLKTLGCGASALLGRPYSVGALKTQMDALARGADSFQKLRAAAKNIDTRAFDAALATYGILLRPTRLPEDYFRVGMRCLKDKRWNHAITAFEHALRNAQIKAEAELGMAAAFRGKGDLTKFAGWLARASETLVRARRWHLARTAYARLLRHDPAAKNPFHAEAHRLIRQKSYDEAADMLVQSLALVPRNLAGDRFARVCFAAEDPDAMLKSLEAGLNRESGFDGEVLGEEIRKSLEILAKERREREKQLAAERKWQLSRTLADRKAGGKAETDAALPRTSTSAESDKVTVAEWDAEPPDSMETVESEMRATANHDFAEDDELISSAMDEEADADSQQVLQPLTRPEATSDLFSKKPKLNEFLSVVKLTWKLAKRSRKK